MIDDQLTRVQLVDKAEEVAEILNNIADDDEREKAQEHFERCLNDSLYAGSQTRERWLAAKTERRRLDRFLVRNLNRTPW